MDIIQYAQYKNYKSVRKNLVTPCQCHRRNRLSGSGHQRTQERRFQADLWFMSACMLKKALGKFCSQFCMRAWQGRIFSLHFMSISCCNCRLVHMGL